MPVWVSWEFLWYIDCVTLNFSQVCAGSKYFSLATFNLEFVTLLVLSMSVTAFCLREFLIM